MHRSRLSCGSVAPSVTSPSSLITIATRRATKKKKNKSPKKNNSHNKKESVAVSLGERVSAYPLEGNGFTCHISIVLRKHGRMALCCGSWNTTWGTNGIDVPGKTQSLDEAVDRDRRRTRRAMDAAWNMCTGRGKCASHVDVAVRGTCCF